MSGMPGNLTYVKTKTGMFRAIAVGIGLLAMAFVAGAYDNAYYLKGKGEKACKLTADTQLFWYNELLKEHNRNPEYNLKPKEPKSLGCPSNWLSIPAIFIIVFTWVVTFILLIVMLIIDLNQKRFAKIDFIVHIVSGVLFILSGLSIAGFVVMVFLSSFPCTEESFKSGRPYRSGSAKKREWTYPIGGFKSCSEQSTWFYQEILLIIGMLLAIGGGVMYILVGLMLKKGAGGAGGPMMMMGGGVQPSQTPSQMQQSPSQYQQQQSPSTYQSPSAHPSQQIPMEA